MCKWGSRLSRPPIFPGARGDELSRGPPLLWTGDESQGRCFSPSCRCIEISCLSSPFLRRRRLGLLSEPMPPRPSALLLSDDPRLSHDLEEDKYGFRKNVGGPASDGRVLLSPSSGLIEPGFRWCCGWGDGNLRDISTWGLPQSATSISKPRFSRFYSHCPNHKSPIATARSRS